VNDFSNDDETMAEVEDGKKEIFPRMFFCLFHTTRFKSDTSSAHLFGRGAQLMPTLPECLSVTRPTFSLSHYGVRHWDATAISRLGA